jgi:hypothetical protein
MLEDMLAHRAPVDPRLVDGLAAARVKHVTSDLADRHAIARTRIVAADTRPGDGAGPPAVRGRLGVDRRSAWPSTPDVGRLPSAWDATTHGDVVSR